MSQLFKFSQYEFEREIHSELAFGDETAIAEKLGRSVTLVSQMYSPHEDRESDLYKAAKFISAHLEVDQCRGLKVLQSFNLFVERHIDRTLARKCTVKAITSVMREFTEMMEARLENKPLTVQLAEVDDVIRAAQTLKEAILDDMSEEMAQEFASTPTFGGKI